MNMLKIFGFLLFFSIKLFGQESTLQNLDFLIGTWKMESRENYESWGKINDALEGESYTIKNGEKKVSESLEITLSGNQIVYMATVFNQNEGKPISFLLNSTEESFYSFENLNHDFPKKIQYKIVNDNELFVSVLGENDRGFSYKLIKITE